MGKLTNYIRVWQASGESEKTSIRVKTRLAQLVQEGRFRGGTSAYGYKTEKHDCINKRGHEVFEIMIDLTEAQGVKLIFDKYINEGYGSQCIASLLTERGVRTQKDSNFVNCTIQNMLKNESYTGIIKSGDTKSEIFPGLQIISPEEFARTQEILSARFFAFLLRSTPALWYNVCETVSMRLTYLLKSKK